MRPRPLLVASARPARFQRGLHPVAPASFFAAAVGMAALSRPADISVFTQRHGCHPVRGSPVLLRPGWDHLHTRFSTTGVRTDISHIRGPITGWSSMRERCCCVSGGISPERCARGPRVGRASRSPCTEVSISSSATGRARP
jgi:hypothetical protein